MLVPLEPRLLLHADAVRICKGNQYAINRPSKQTWTNLIQDGYGVYMYTYIYICSVSLSVSLHVCVISSLNHGSAIFQCHTQVILYTLLCNHADGSFSSACVLTALSRYFGCLHTYTRFSCIATFACYSSPVSKAKPGAPCFVLGFRRAAIPCAIGSTHKQPLVN